jgi:VRR-NUC domain
VSIRPRSEKGFQAAVVQLARLRGWLVAHFRPARTARGWRTPVQADGAGFCDLVMVRPRDRRVLFAELKSDRGLLTPAQAQWIQALFGTGAEVHIWRPADMDRIEEVLA